MTFEMEGKRACNNLSFPLRKARSADERFDVSFTGAEKFRSNDTIGVGEPSGSGSDGVSTNT
jgi:hypothetical protein